MIDMRYEKPSIVSLSLTELENAKYVAMLQDEPLSIGASGGCYGMCCCQCQCQSQWDLEVKH